MSEAGEAAPPSEPEFLDADVALQRIEALVANARTVWFGLIGFLAFIGLTLLSVRDVDFFSVTATTDLPIVDIAIPTATFFWTAALLAALLHTYFHVFVIRLWDALAEAPSQIGRLKLGDCVLPWLVNDWALRRRPDRPVTQRPMDLVGDVVTSLVIWLATPLVLFGFWWRSLPAHDARLSLAIAAALSWSLFTSLRGWRRARTRLRRPGIGSTGRFRRRRGIRAWLGGLARGLGLTVLWLTMLASLPILFLVTLAGAGEHHLPPIFENTLEAHWPKDWPDLPLVWASLVNAEIAIKPTDWRDPEIARRRFHIDWCRDAGLSPHACEKPEHADQELARLRWCRELEIEDEDCAARFREIDAAFEAEWQIEREANLSTIVGPDLRGRDLRQASASGAYLTRVDLYEARLEGAYLRGAQLEGAYLGGAQLEGADLFGARLEGAELGGAQLEGADLFGARLEGADLFGARLEGTNLRGAQLQSAEWAGATIGASPAHSANFTGGRNLTQTQLEQVIGVDETILPLDAETGEQLYVSSCWENMPERLEQIWVKHRNFTPERLRKYMLNEGWLCAEGEVPRRVGSPATPAAEVESSRAPGTPEAERGGSAPE